MHSIDLIFWLKIVRHVSNNFDLPRGGGGGGGGVFDHFCNRSFDI